MNYDFIQEYCLSKPGTEEDYKAAWDANRYRVCEKMYAMLYLKGNVPEVVLKQMLDQAYELVVAGLSKTLRERLR